MLGKKGEEQGKLSGECYCLCLWLVDTKTALGSHGGNSPRFEGEVSQQAVR